MKGNTNAKQVTLVSGETIKTVNGENLLGSGNIAIVTNHAFNPNWNNSGSYTTLDFCDSVNADPNAIVGMSYIGTLKCSDIPIPTIGNVKQGDATVKIIGQGQSSKIITIELSSSSTYPYKWEYSYHSGHTDVGWIGFQPELPDQTNNNGKFLTTNGTTMSWAEVQTDLSEYAFQTIIREW